MPPSAPDLGDPSSAPLPDECASVELSELRFDGDAAAGRDASGARFFGCAMNEVDLSDAVLRRATFRDVSVRGGSWANVEGLEASLTRVEMRAARLTGAAFTRGTLADVTFADCRLDLSSFRFARLERVRFERCRMEETDLSGVRASDVVFEACDLGRASLAEATFERSAMHDCTLDAVGNPERLRGIAMPPADVVRNAGTLAQAVGIRVLDA